MAENTLPPMVVEYMKLHTLGHCALLVSLHREYDDSAYSDS